MHRGLYQKLQVHLDAMPVGFPKAASGVEQKLLQLLYTPDEAAVALRMSLAPMSAAKVTRRMSRGGDGKQEAMADMLERMYKKGLLDKYGSHSKEPRYALTMFVIGSYEYQAGRMGQEFAEHADEYLDGAFADEMVRTKITQMRTIPINQSLTPDNRVMPYDRAEDLIKHETGTFGVAQCVCRQNRDLVGKKCQHTDKRETCLLFGHVADHWIDIGIARKITQEESLTYLREAQDAGLVLQPTNIKKPKAICCCCGCCCGMLRIAKHLPKPVEVFATNFYATLDQKSCVGCKLCMKRCHMEAITYADKKCSINLDRCIGCGVCVPVCKKGSIKLLERQQITEPYNSFKDLYLAIMRKKAGFFGHMKFIVKHAVHALLK